MMYKESNVEMIDVNDFMDKIYNETLDIKGPKKIIICVSTDEIFKMNSFNFDHKGELIDTLQKVTSTITVHPELFVEELPNNVIPFRPRKV